MQKCQVCESNKIKIEQSDHLKVLKIVGYTKTCLTCGYTEYIIQKNPIPVKE